MSGTIFISEQKSVTISTISFDYLLENMRDFFQGDDKRFADDIYEQMDKQDCTFVYLDKQQKEGFNAFARSMLNMFKEHKSEKFCISRKATWEELIELLKTDSRCDPNIKMLFNDLHF
ncbi:hypothetical protein ACO0LM_15905 [Undibacterium sp. Di26W]|uniref:hypothetical protein n=1 Tax=Undibacterium sp. Di26W TaxID=3413035 RepID=UPI003BEF8104